ncbi:MAG: hypothetical protein ACLP9L_03110 [Thermoguttaceae bacterium]
MVTKGGTPDWYLMPVFPWPPPKPSALALIPRQLLPTPAEKAAPKLKHVAYQLERALDNAGYSERSYYAIPNGFALVSRLEQFKEDGSPEKPPARFDLEVRPQVEFSLMWYLKALFTAQRGHFRLIVFAVTDVPFVSDQQRITSRDEAVRWLEAGMTKLPEQVGTKDFAPDYDLIALIYEFERPTPDHDFSLKVPSTLQGQTHLEKAGLWPPWSK